LNERPTCRGFWGGEKVGSSILLRSGDHFAEMEEKKMPNYVSNGLTITGPNVEKVLSAIKGDNFYDKDDKCEYTVYLDPEKIAPVPEGLDNEANHDWRVEHWGDKCVYPDRQTLEVESGEVTIYFTSAFTPPVELIETIARLFPENSFSLGFSGDHGTAVPELWKWTGHDWVQQPVDYDEGTSDADFDDFFANREQIMNAPRKPVIVKRKK
jgi:hypothetical protein